MKIISDQTHAELVNLQPIGQIHPGSAIPAAPVECADDAPC